MVESISKHRLELARDLLDDIELSRLPPEQLLLKASRLARISEDIEAREWLNFELVGYANSEKGRKYMDKMWRWTNKDLGYGHWMPFAALNGTIAAMQIQAQQLQVPNVQLSVSSANPHEFVTGMAGSNLGGISGPANAVLTRLNGLTSSITELTGIRSRVLAHIHSFASRTFYSLAFSGAAESIFQLYQTSIDDLLRNAAPDVLEKIPSISERLAIGDGEAISQALNSCRRMIKAFADSVYPPNETPVVVDGRQYEVGGDKVLNRIQLFLQDKCTSESRRDRLNKGLRRIHEKLSAGSKTDLIPGEARALFLGTYLFLGEILDASKGGGNVAPVKDAASA